MKRALLTVLALVLIAGVAARFYLVPPEKVSTPPAIPPAAQQGAEQSKAPLQLARAHFLGLNCVKDETVGAAIVKQAADKGDMQAIGLMGVLYLGGIGVEQDFDEALKWLSRSTEQEGRELYARMQGFMSALEKLPPEEKQKQMDTAKASAKTDMRDAFMKALEKAPQDSKGEQDGR